MSMPIPEPVAPAADDAGWRRFAWMIFGGYIVVFALGCALILWGRTPVIAVRTGGSVHEQTLGLVVAAWLRYDLGREATVVGKDAAADILCGRIPSGIWRPVGTVPGLIGPIAIRSSSPAAEPAVHASLERFMRELNPAQMEAATRDHATDPATAARIIFSAVVRSAMVELARE